MRTSIQFQSLDSQCLRKAMVRLQRLQKIVRFSSQKHFIKRFSMLTDFVFKWSSLYAYSNSELTRIS